MILKRSPIVIIHFCFWGLFWLTHYYISIAICFSLYLSLSPSAGCVFVLFTRHCSASRWYPLRSGPRVHFPKWFFLPFLFCLFHVRDIPDLHGFKRRASFFSFSLHWLASTPSSSDGGYSFSEYRKEPIFCPLPFLNHKQKSSWSYLHRPPKKFYIMNGDVAYDGFDWLTITNYVDLFLSSNSSSYTMDDGK